jgi:hypothetical protein
MPQNSLDIATQGLLSNNSLTVAVQGFLASITIEEIVDAAIIQSYTGDIFPHVEEEKKKLFKIKVTVTIDGKDYTEEKMVYQMEKPKVEDVNISIDQDHSPKIKISF